MMIGGLCICLPLFVCSYTTNFYLFVILYSVVIGLGFGLLYMLSVRNAWQFFPSKKGMISGSIMSCYSVGAIFWILLSKQVANPNNIKPLDIYRHGEDKVEYFYTADSEVVKNVPIMLRTLAIIYAAMIVAATVCISKRIYLPFVRVSLT
jgi:MFS family permease